METTQVADFETPRNTPNDHPGPPELQRAFVGISPPFSQPWAASLLSQVGLRQKDPLAHEGDPFVDI